MLPAFLKKYKSDLEKYKLDAIRIKATPLKNGQSGPIKKSKLLGRPYLPITLDYPLDKYGKPLVMLAQINFGEMPPLKNYPKKGILQVFTPPMFWDEGNEYYLYLYHKITEQAYHKSFPILSPEYYEMLPIDCEHKLAFSKEVEYGGPADFRFDFSFGAKSFYDFRDELSEKQQIEFDNLFQSSGHKIGGYAYFTQSDPRAHQPAKKDDVLLLQIDSDKEIMFGDAGISNIFINIEDLKKRRFEKAYFNWDCA
jgi:uncharacterized protein YwqG